MPTFDTPEPISVRIDLPGGEVRIIAGDRTDTVVEVWSGDDEEQVPIQVGYAGGTLVVKAARPETSTLSSLSRHAGGTGALVAAALRQSWSWSGLSGLFGDWDSTRVTIELPSGSHVQGEAMAGEFHCAGRLGDCRLKTDYGDIRLDSAATIRLSSDSGEITVEPATGRAEITAGSGDIRINELDGTALIRNDDGEIYLGEVTGDLRLIGVNGDMHVHRTHGDVEAKTVHGSVRIGEIARGSVVLTSTTGDLEVGIRQGTAAWLDVSTANGSLVNSLAPHDGPEAFDESVEIRARSHDGDIVIRRA
ncbi:DUF4097 family beta strand repeat-containing protein [Nonomuraea sp. SYSU D8015]|uniref:DUF4097 family beta strand repeat-containing protein n=1 Tax=Nonomuraea sp. SYSU D8015 TaxID=2593644 RepID=UPI0016605F4D|nr:DUF4097 family beta strand repeat-containing protein [Nonomuraea sp. SYSU D8015]